MALPRNKAFKFAVEPSEPNSGYEPHFTTRNKMVIIFSGIFPYF
jgi:hypothetical protein